MIVALASLAAVLLSAPTVAVRFTRRVHPRDWTRWSLVAALVVGAVAAEAALVHALVAACARMTGSLMPGGPVVGWSVLSVATLGPVAVAFEVLQCCSLPGSRSSSSSSVPRSRLSAALYCAMSTPSPASRASGSSPWASPTWVSDDCRFLARERRFDLAQVPAGPRSAILVGMAFSFGWAPCIGPVLATILTAAAATQTVAWGAILLALYSVGLGLPFIALALGMHRAKASLGWLRDMRARSNALAAWPWWSSAGRV